MKDDEADGTQVPDTAHEQPDDAGRDDERWDEQGWDPGLTRVEVFALAGTLASGVVLTLLVVLSWGGLHRRRR